MNKIVSVAIHQPGYFPWLGFFHKINLADIYVVLDDCRASKGNWDNRVNIKGNSGPIQLTVPFYKKNRSSQLVNEVQIDFTKNWRGKHTKTFKQNYFKAPFFDEVYDLFNSTLNNKSKNLIDLNLDGIRRLFGLLDMKKVIILSSEIDHPESTSTLRLINIVKALGANRYINGLGSGEYLEKELFEKNNIQLYCQRYETFEYSQVGRGRFMPGLSIIDTLANIGINGVLSLIKKNNELNGI